MVVGVDQAVVPLLAPQQFDGPVGDDLVGVHIQAGTCSALDRVHDERLVELARGDLLTGGHDGVGHPLLQKADLVIGDGRSLLDLRDGVDELRMHGQAGDGKVLRRPQGLHPVIDVFGNGPLPHGIVLGAVKLLLIGHGSAPLCKFSFILQLHCTTAAPVMQALVQEFLHVRPLFVNFP